MSNLKGRFYLVWCFGDKVDIHKHTYIQIVFNLTHLKEGVAMWDPGHVNPSHVCMYTKFKVCNSKCV